jgi:hypothetical protein
MGKIAAKLRQVSQDAGEIPCNPLKNILRIMPPQAILHILFLYEFSNLSLTSDCYLLWVNILS